MVFDFSEKIYKAFADEYHCSAEYMCNKNWKKFIHNKDIGIIDITQLVYLQASRVSKYLIVDEKKWLLAKIKYGI